MLNRNDMERGIRCEKVPFNIMLKITLSHEHTQKIKQQKSEMVRAHYSQQHLDSFIPTDSLTDNKTRLIQKC